MTALSLLLAATLVLVSALHAYWGIGGVWPGTDRKSCARAVVGFAGAPMPGVAACFAVAGMLALFGLLAPAVAGVFATPFRQSSLAGAALFVGLVFLFRGALGFTPFWRRMTPEMPFAQLDRRYYSPLCLALGAGFLVLALEGLAAA
jgi:hypothetical protein